MSFPGLRSLAIALCAALLAISPAAAQSSGDAKPNDQQKPAEPKKSDAARWADHLAEAARKLSGPAGNPECVWLGERVVNLLSRDDLDTAFRHLDLYDRFGCPGDHIRVSFRCMARQPTDPKETQTLEDRVRGCWTDPSVVPPPPAAANAASAPAPTSGTGAK